MGSFELERKKDHVNVTVQAGTRAGLLISALQALSAAQGAIRIPGADVQDRAFELADDDFTVLFSRFLQMAVDQGKAYGEVFEDVRFDLATDKKITGAFAGHPAPDGVRFFSRVPATEVRVARGDMGWKASFVFVE